MDTLTWVVDLYSAEFTSNLYENAFVTHGFGTFAILIAGWVLFCAAIDMVRYCQLSPS